MNKKEIVKLLEERFVKAINKFDEAQDNYKKEIEKRQKAYADGDYETKELCDYKITEINEVRTAQASISDEIAIILSQITENGYDDEYEYLYNKYNLYKTE